MSQPLAPQHVQLDPRYFDHPKIRLAGRPGRELHLRSLCHANLLLTDGFVDHDVALRLARAALATGQLVDVSDADALNLTATLVALGLWEHADGGFAIHDYAEYQVCRESLITRRRRDRERKQQRVSARIPRAPSPHTPHPFQDSVQSVSSSPAVSSVQSAGLNDAHASAGLNSAAPRGSLPWFVDQLSDANERTLPAVATVVSKWRLPEAALYCALEEVAALGAAARSPAALFVAKLDSYGREGRYVR